MNPENSQNNDSPNNESVGMNPPEPQDMQAQNDQSAPTNDQQPMEQAVTAAQNTIGTLPAAKSKKPLLIALVVGLVVLVVGALMYLLVFSKSSDSEDTSSTNETTVSVGKDIPLLRVGIMAENLDNELPNNADSYSTTMGIYYQTHEALVTFEDLTQIRPLIAESWTNPDENTWSFTIAEDRTFHTGKKLTAADVAASLNEYKESEIWDPMLATVESIAVDPNDDNQLIIKTTTPDSILLNKLTTLPIYDVDYEEGKSWASGTGAYTLKEGTAVSKEKLELVADDNYPLGRPSVREIVYNHFADTEEFETAVLNGEFDIANVYFTILDETLAKSDLVIDDIKGLGSFFASLSNLREGPLKDIKVREALSYVINGNDFVSEGEDLPASQMVPEEVPGYTSSIDMHEQDFEKAAELLAEAGYAKPSDLNVTVGYLKGAQDADAEILIKQLTDAGITVTEKVKETGPEFVQAIGAGEFDIIMYAYATSINDLTENASAIASSDSIYGHYENTEVDALIKKANTTFDQQERLAILQDINTTIADDYGILPLRVSVYKLVHKKNYQCKHDIPTSDIVCYFYKMTDKE